MREYYEKGKLIWVAPGAIQYTIEHLELLLPWLYHMREGAYPAEPSSSYTGGKRSGLNAHAPYESVCQVAAEIDRRLAQTGLDRYLVEDYYCQDIPVEELAKRVSLDAGRVNMRIKNAVSYIASGTCPRWLDCRQCGRYAKCQKQKKDERKPMTYRDWIRYKSRERDRRARHKYTIFGVKA